MRITAHSNVQALGLGLLLGLGLCLPPGLQAALPDTLNYQGRVRLTSGAAVADSTTNNVAFALYTQATGGTPIWSENQSGVTTTAGLFNVVLGSVTPLTVPFDQPYWLGVNFNGDGEMAPRTPLTMAPYAFKAKGLALPANFEAAVMGAPVLAVRNTDNLLSTSTALRAESEVNAIEAFTAGLSSNAVRGVATGQGTGMVGEAWNTGIGVRGTSNSGPGLYGSSTSGPALRLSGTGILDASSGLSITVASYISFTAGTNLSTGVPNPLSLANSVSGAVISGANTVAATNGAGLSGTAVSSGPASVIGVYGAAQAPSAVAAGLVGTAVSGSSAIGVFGRAQSTGQRFALAGTLDPTSEYSTFGAPFSAAVVGWGHSGAGVQGHGVYGRTGGDASVYGVLAEHTAGGIAMRADSVTGTGLLATGQFAAISASASSTSGAGLYVVSSGNSGHGVRVFANNVGVSATAANAGGTGVYGLASSSGAGTAYGVQGFSQSVGAGSAGVKGESLAVSGPVGGVYGVGASPQGWAVRGDNSAGTGVLGSGVTGTVGSSMGGGGTGVLARQNAGALALKAEGASLLEGVATIVAITPTDGALNVTNTAGTGVAIGAQNWGTAIRARNDDMNSPTVDALNTAGGVGLRVNNMNFPAVDGAAGQVLGTDGGGNLAWVTAGGVPNPLYLSGTSAGGIITGDNLGGPGVRGVGSNTGSVGVHGLGSGAPAVGVLAESVSGAALRLSGSAIVDAANGGTITVASYVSFTAGTNLGGGVVSAPLSLTLSSASSAPLFVNNSGGGNAVSVTATGPGITGAAVHARNTGASSLGVYGRAAIGVVGSSSDFPTFSGTSQIGVFGYDGSGGVGVWGRGLGASKGVVAEGGVIGVSATATAANGVAGHFQGPTGVAAYSNQMPIYALNTLGGGFLPAVLGEASGTGLGMVGRNLSNASAGGLGGSLQNFGGNFYSGVGVHGVGRNFGTGWGVIGEGDNGVYGRVTGGTGVAVRAEAVAGAIALISAGNAQFDGLGNTVTFNTYVSFTAGTNLALGPVPPVQWSAPAAHPLGVLTATNTGSGYGLLGYATAPGIDLGGPVQFGDVLTAGVHGYTSASMSAGVIGRSAAPGQDNVGVLGMALQGAGVIGKSFGAGHGGEFESAAGIGVVGLGVTGVAASTEVAGGLALLADQGTGARALQVLGDARFGPKSGSASVTFTTHVDFSGATVTGLAPVSAPLSLSSPSMATAISAFNTNGGHAGYFSTGASSSNALEAHGGTTGGFGLVATGHSGISVTAQNAFGTALIARSSSPSHTIDSRNDGAGSAVNGYSFTGHGIRGRSSGSNMGGVFGEYGSGMAYSVPGGGGSGVIGLANFGGAFGVFGRGLGGGVVGQGPVGVSGSATSAGGSGVYGSITFGTGAGVRGETGDNSSVGVAGFNTAGGSAGSGVYGQSSGPGGYGVQGYASSTGAGDTNRGVYGRSDGGSGFGVYGYAAAATGGNSGVYGVTASNDGKGVYGEATNYAGNSFGVYGIGGHGVYGMGGFTGAAYGVWGNTTGGGSAAGVVGQYNGATIPSGQGNGVGVIGVNASANGWAMQAVATGLGGQGLVVTAESVGVSASANSSSAHFGVHSRVDGTGLGVGVAGQSFSGTRVGVYGNIDPNITSPPQTGAVVASGGSVGVGVSAWNDVSGSQAIYGSNTNADPGSRGVHGSGYIGVYGNPDAGNPTGLPGRIGVAGQSTSNNAFGVHARNIAATVAGGGAALHVQGIIRVTQSSNSYMPTANIAATLNGAHVRVGFNAGGAFTTITLTNNVVTTNSTVVATFNTANQPTGYSVKVAAGVATLQLNNSLTVSATEGVNFLVINN